MDENKQILLWPLGLVIDVNVGRDGLVHSVRLNTKSTELVRPLTKKISFVTVSSTMEICTRNAGIRFGYQYKQIIFY